MDLALVPMSPVDFDRRIAALREHYAGSLVTGRGLSPEYAETESARQIAEQLPRGVRTERAILRTAQVDGQEVGWIWVALPDRPRQSEAWIHNITVDPEHRSKGYGRAMIQAVEAELSRRGVSRLGLNVFADNPGAIRLYESLGFRVMAQQMAKPLAVQPAPAGGDGAAASRSTAG